MNKDPYLNEFRSPVIAGKLSILGNILMNKTRPGATYLEKEDKISPFFVLNTKNTICF